MPSFDREKVRKMLVFILKMPTEEDTHNRAHKFPFIASEIFSSDCPIIFEMFFSEPEEIKAPTLKLKKELMTESPVKEESLDLECKEGD